MAKVEGGVVEKATPAFHYGARRKYSNSISNERTIELLLGDHRDDTLVVVGSGPSLKGFPFSQLNDASIFTMVINDEIERSEGLYNPDLWVFNDPGVMDRYRDKKVSREIGIVTRYQNILVGINGAVWPNRPIPDWLNRVYTYKPCSDDWASQPDMVLMRRTTATACICLGVGMGFKKIILIGQDMYALGDSYYYDGSKGRGTHRSSCKRVGPNMFMEERHASMLADYTKLNVILKKRSWDGEIVQTSLHSPLSCFKKMPWSQAFAWAHA